MTRTTPLLAVAALALAAVPVSAQGHDHAAAPADQAHQMDANAMICSMGMLPHGNMGGGMGMMNRMGGGGMGAMMQRGQQPAAQAQVGQQQHQHGQQQPAQAAQGQQHAGMQHGATGGAKMSGMGGGMEHPLTPTMLIHHAKDLELTQDQVAKVTALATSSKSDCETHMKAAMEAHHAASALLGGPAATPDLGAYEGKLREATTHVLQAHVGVVRAGQQARALLTPAQIEKLAAHDKPAAKPAK